MWMEAFSDSVSAPADGTVIGVGLDLVQVDRAARLLKVHGETLLRRIFLDAEGTRDDLCLPPDHFATVLAAKEAFFKALGHGLAGPLDWPQVEVRATEEACLTPRGPTLDAALERGVTHILFNVGAAADVRFAFAILWRDSHGR